MQVEPTDIITVTLRVSPATWAYLCYALYTIVLLLLVACMHRLYKSVTDMNRVETVKTVPVPVAVPAERVTMAVSTRCNKTNKVKSKRGN